MLIASTDMYSQSTLSSSSPPAQAPDPVSHTSQDDSVSSSLECDLQSHTITPSPPEFEWDLHSPTPSPPEWNLLSPTPSPPEWDLLSPTPSPPEWDLVSGSPTPSPPEWDLLSATPSPPEWDLLPLHQN